MSPNLPENLPNLTDPIDTDALASSNGKTAGQIVRELNAEVEAIGKLVVGPASVSAKSGTAIVSEVPIHDCESLTAGAPVAGTWVGVGTTMSVITVAGADHAIRGIMNAGYGNDPLKLAKFYVNLAGNQAVTTRSHVAVDFLWNIPATGTKTSMAQDLVELVVSDAVSLGGTVKPFPIPAHVPENVWTTVYIPVFGLTNLRSLGVRANPRIARMFPTLACTIQFNNIRWPVLSQLEEALGGSALVTVPPSYAAAQKTLFLPPGKEVIDWRSNKMVVSNYNGVKHLRQFQADIAEDASVDCTAKLQEIMGGLADGDTLLFPRRKAFLINDSITLQGKRDVTFDFNDSAIVQNNWASDTFLVFQMVNPVFKNFRIHSVHDEVQKLEPELGTPVFPSSTLNGGVDASQLTLTVADGSSFPLLNFWITVDVGAKFEEMLVTSRTGNVLTITSRGMQETTAQAHLTGVPVASLRTMKTSVRGDVIRTNTQRAQAKDWHGNIPVEVTLSDTAHTADDCVIEWFDAYCPPPPTVVQVGTQGPIPPGAVLTYQVADIDSLGHISGLSLPTTITTTSWCRVDVSFVRWTTYHRHPTGNVIARRIYRTMNDPHPDDAQYFAPAIDEIPETAPTYRDNQPDPAVFYNETITPTFADGGAGVLGPGLYAYYVTTVDSAGREHTFKKDVVKNGPWTITLATNRKTTITLPPAGTSVARRIYRQVGVDNPQALWNNGSRDYRLVGEVTNPATTTFTDNTPEETLDNTLERVPSVDATLAGDALSDYSGMRIPALTSTPTVYRFDFEPGPGPLTSHIGVRVRKLTSSVNTITVHQIHTFGRGGDNAGTGSGFDVGAGARNALFEDGTVDGVSGDGIRQGGDAIGTVARRVHIRAVGRQGMSGVGGHDFTLEDCDISETGRSGFDFEPSSALSESQRITIRNTAFRNTGLNAITLHWCPYAILENVTSQGPAGAGFLQSISGGGDSLRIIDCWTPYQDVDIWGRDINVDGLHALSLTVSEKGGEGENVRLYTKKPQRAYIDNVKVSTRPIIGIQNAVVKNVSVVDVLDDVIADNIWLNVDTGSRRVAGLDKGVISVPPWYPRGLTVRDEAVSAVRGLSSTATQANNLRGTAAISGGATSAGVAFPTHAYGQVQWSSPTSGAIKVNVADLGTMAAATYFYRIFARPILGGMNSVGAVAEHAGVAVASPNNSMQLLTYGFEDDIAGVTIFRGTATGVYTARYDLIPDQDVYHIAQDPDTVNFKHTFVDYGSVLLTDASDIGIQQGPDRSYGYPKTTAVQSPGPFTVANETGYEIDTSYSVFITTSWQTTYIVTKSRSGFTVTFGTAAPGGGGTCDWFVVR